MEPNSPQKDRGNAIRQIALAFELPLLIVVPPLAGGAAGYFLDRWFDTKPILMIILGVLGAVIGIRDVLKAANSEEKRDGE
ncbi:MAG: AtpZ/AtpI family protein [Candidatus Acidiferrales bacterium]